ncbi:type II toxin-antitoxin system HicB family antitoxin [Paenibacillus sp. MWE-103]|uniref:Type II toxin-antitoxin system HicB family antitoxin n=1 Tax=Paenibacillus artemisiicola TaxID=1172618 RepID=A0ABS3WBX7_9BACL|nr:type II toxin-antitoxin system HicB family antitoxin [Paenibacillus artemisiicola]MBO7745808.1 type II toxin-antitoxin system HicB family antitoxin [Paenibacillus artemisiicola]
MQTAAKISNKVLITLLFEGNQSDRNYSVYIPELRLGVIGDTLEEARENAIDLARMELTRLIKTVKKNVPIIERLEIEFG